METTTNEAAVLDLKGLGFRAAQNPAGAAHAGGRDRAKPAEACGVTRATVAAHIRGGRPNLGVQVLLAHELPVRQVILSGAQRIFGQHRAHKKVV